MRCWRILAACSIFGEYYNLVPWAGKGQQNGFWRVWDGEADAARPFVCLESVWRLKEKPHSRSLGGDDVADLIIAPPWRWSSWRSTTSTLSDRLEAASRCWATPAPEADVWFVRRGGRGSAPRRTWWWWAGGWEREIKMLSWNMQCIWGILILIYLLVQSSV